MKLHGSSEYLILALRALWLIMASATAAVSYLLFKRLLPRPLAAGCAAAFLLFVPFTIPAVSYNTLGAALLTVGLALLAIDAIDESTRIWRPVLAGLVHGLAVFAYPSLVVAAFTACLSVVAIGATKRRYAACIAYPAALFGALMAIVVALVSTVGVRTLSADYVFTTAGSQYAGGITKLVVVVHQVVKLMLPALLVGALFVLVVIALWSRVPRARVVLAAVPFATWFLVRPGGVEFIRSLLWLTAMCLPLLVLLAKTKREDPLSTVALLVVPPALVGGLATTYTSSNGAINAAVGLCPALLVALPLLLRSAIPEEFGSANFRGWLPALIIVSILLGLTVANYSAAFGDEPPLRLTAVVASGPYAGLQTTPQNAALAQSISADIAAYSPHGSRALVFYGFAGAYPVLGLRPATPMLWLERDAVPSVCDPHLATMLSSYYGSHPLPDVIVVMSPQPTGALPAALAALVSEGGYRSVVRRPAYTVLVSHKSRDRRMSSLRDWR